MLFRSFLVGTSGNDLLVFGNGSSAFDVATASIAFRLASGATAGLRRAATSALKRGAKPTIELPAEVDSNAPEPTLFDRYCRMLDSGLKHSDAIKSLPEELQMPTPEELSEEALAILVGGVK